MVNSIKFKAQESLTPSTAEAIQMKNDLEEAIKQIDDASKYSQYLEASEQAELAKSRALLQADVAALDYFLETGKWLGPTLPAEALYETQFTSLGEVDQGWYTYDNLTDEMKQTIIKNGNEISVQNNSVTNPETGLPVPTNLWFVMKSDSDPAKDMKKIEGKTVGQDVEVTVTYGDGHKDKFIIKGAAVRPDIQIGVLGTKVEGHGIYVDFSKTKIVDPKTGMQGGVYVIGSRQNDTIYGSAGSGDQINGAGGSDKLDGMGGTDDVFGYASDAVRNAYGDSELGVDSDDTISDRFGTSLESNDFVDGGDGIDSYLRSTENIGNRMESWESVKTNNPKDIEGWFSGSNVQKSVQGDELVISGDAINIKSGDGYMLTAQEDGDDIVFNVLKPGVNGGEPSYFKVRIKDYNKLQITGSFVDMSGVNVGTKPVTLTGTGNGGDILVGPKTIYEEYALDVEDLGTSNVDVSTLNERLEPWQSETTNSIFKNAKVEGGAIVVDASQSDIFTDTGEIDIPGDIGASAFVVHKKDSSGKKYLEITVASNEGNYSERIVIKVTNIESFEGEPKVKINGMASDVYDLGDGSLGTGVLIDGKGGTDFTAGFKKGTKFAEGTKGTSLGYATPVDHKANEISGANSQDEFLEKIANANSFESLDKKDGFQDIVDDMTDPIAKADAQAAINEKRKEIIEAELTVLGTDIGEFDSEDKPEKANKLKTKIEEKFVEIQKQMDILEGKNKDLYNEVLGMYQITEGAFTSAKED